jgi:hypothetical protein
MYFFALFILTLGFSQPAHTYDKKHLETLSKHIKWTKLLHYQPTLFGGFKSQADGENFFLHKNGKHSPLDELKEAVKAFGAENLPKDGHPICRFPLRYKWLNKELGGPWKADFSGCTKYVEFFSKLAAKRASIVFSSYYLSNPNSAFGHTFMRLSRYDDKNETEMLDYGINYSAQATSTNPFSYAVMGLFGGFKGKFAAIPYYYKVREYSNSEFRDLWSYDLNLTLMQVLEMVDHIWELGDTWFDYFYFQENCSYHLLSVIEVASPESDLTSKYPLFTIPADTVRGLKQAGLITAGKRRESTYSKLVRLSDGLAETSLAKASEIAARPKETNRILNKVETKKAAAILDVAIEAFDYYNAREILSEDEKYKALKENILRARATNPVITDDKFLFDTNQDESPALSHAPSRFGLYQGYENLRGSFTRIEVRTSFHDLLDPPRGSMKNAQIEMGNFALKYIEEDYRDAQVIFNHLSVVSIRNFQEQSFWASPYSWEIDVGASQMRDLACRDCPGGYLLGSVGNSINVLDQRLLFAFLINGEANWQDLYQDGYRLGVGPKLYSRYKFNDQFLTALEILYHWDTYRFSKSFSDHRAIADWEMRYHFHRDLSLAWKSGMFEQNSTWMGRSEIGLQYFY